MAFRYAETSTFSLLYDEINRIFKEMLQIEGLDERSLDTMEIPSVDIYETKNAIFVEIEAPGIDPEKIKVSFYRGNLFIEGSKEEMVEEGRLNYICMERAFGHFQRVIPINKPVNISKSEGQYKHGILSIKLAKIAEKRGEKRTITIKTEEDSEEGFGR